MPKMIMLVGLPCSGKSTYLNNRNDLDNFEVLSSDNIIEKQAKKLNKTYDETFSIYSKTAMTKFYQDLEKAISAKKNIVIDRTNLTKSLRKKLLDKFPIYYEKEAVDFNVSLDTVKKRNQQRKQQGKSIPEDVLESMNKSKDAVSKNEGFDKITVIDTNQKESLNNLVFNKKEGR